MAEQFPEIKKKLGFGCMRFPMQGQQVDEEIVKQEEQVAKSKAKYDADVKKLKDLYAKKDEMKKKELLAAVEKSSKTYEEILRFLQGEA